MKNYKTVIGILSLLFIYTTAHSQIIQRLIQQGQLDTVITIIENDDSAAFNLDNRHCTPLHYSAFVGSMEITNLLLSKGANIDAQDVNGNTPANYAAFGKRNEVLQILIDQGADINKPNRNGRTTINYAVDQKANETIDLLLKNGAEIEINTPAGDELFETSVSSGLNNLTEYMINKGASLDIKRKDNGSLLHSASIGNNIVIIKSIINKNDDVNAKTDFGYSALHYASFFGHRDIVKFLLDNSADPNSKNCIGKTPLHFARESEQNEIVQLLLDNGAKDFEFSFPDLKSTYLGQKEPGLTPELFAPGIISTEDFDERDITFSPDFTEFYTTKYSRTRRMQMTIMESKYRDNKWSEPVKSSISSEFNDAECFITPDGEFLYLISARPVEDDRPSTWEIWYYTKENDEWKNPKMLGSEFKGGFYPTFTNEGVMYFTHASQDLHFSIPENGEYTTSKTLGDNVNTERGEYNSCIAPDESYIIYTSVGIEESFGAGDLYISFRNDDGSWCKAINMGAEINTEGEEYCPSITPDGKYFFFTSNKKGTEDIYWVSVETFKNLNPNK